MNEIRIHQVEMLHLLWLIPALIAFAWYAGNQRAKALRSFIDAGLLDRIPISVSPVRRKWKTALMLLAVTFIVLGLSRPAWNPTPKTVKRQGRDVVFVLDVSRSMLAEDLKPSRLDRAKLAILDCVESLQGDRVGLVAFAGTAAVKCPLTLDYGFFRLMLNRISTDTISRGGTMIGDALRRTLDDVFESQEKQFKDIILITDGEDHDSFPIEAAKQLGERGIRLIAIGLGDENEGKRIPITDETGHPTFLKYQGEEVWSRLDADSLRNMVNATPGGRYLNVATGTLDLGRVYQDLIATAKKKHLEAQTIQQYEDKFQVFLGFAYFCLCLEQMLSDRRKNRQPRKTD